MVHGLIDLQVKVKVGHECEYLMRDAQERLID
jgi:hypothetical protein